MDNTQSHRTFICCFPNLGASRDSSHSDLAPLGSRVVTLPKPVKAEQSRAEPNRGNTNCVTFGLKRRFSSEKH